MKKMKKRKLWLNWFNIHIVDIPTVCTSTYTENILLYRGFADVLKVACCCSSRIVTKLLFQNLTVRKS